MAGKPERTLEFIEVVYDTERWFLLKELRAKAKRIMEALHRLNLSAIVYGSIARGDVHGKSDVDVFIPHVVSSFVVEAALERGGIRFDRRFVVQATPVYAMKAYIEIDENTSVSFPLMKLRKVEREFYAFGGEASFEDLRAGLRLAGVDKRLMLIEPTERGHFESSIIGREDYAAKRLGISAETVLDRVHALLRRDAVGRTGVFIEKELRNGETFEMTLKKLAEQNPAVRRRLMMLD